MLSMFTRHTASDISTTTPQPHVPYISSKRLALHSALALCITCTGAILLTGCGGGTDATTRTQPTTTPPSNQRTSFIATIKSPVNLTNVRARAVDSATGAVLDQQIISSGNTIALTIPVAFIKANNIIVLTLEPINSSSSYSDPMLNLGKGGQAKFNQTLHALISMNSADVSYKVDPFSEVAYQRALIRSGTYNPNTPLLTRLTLDQVNLANTEATYAFGTGTTAPYASNFDDPKDIAAPKIYSSVNSIGGKTIDGTVQATYFALAQLALYAQNNTGDASPYLGFAMRAALDMRDGDLDGLTTFGADTAGTALISQPILYTGVVSHINSDPDHNDIVSLIAANTTQRTARGNVLKVAANVYFDNVNAALPVDSRMDTDTRTYLRTADYSVFNSPLDTSGSITGTPTTNPQPTTRVGAGNYTVAFGLPTGVSLKTAIDASDLTQRTNDIVQLAGVYTNNAGCKLSIGYDGSFELAQGGLLYRAVISREYSDSIVRISGTQYRINIITADKTAPAFIQVMTDGAHVLSVVEGRSTKFIPTTLDTVDLTCSF
jgi:hypothetical protein